MNWRVFHKAKTASTNADARAGAPGDVFTADCQTAGRGRLGHKWLSRPGENLALSAVVGVGGLESDHVATLPLAAGLAVCEAVAAFVPSCAGGGARVSLKWPNDVFADGLKIAGILCERFGERVVVGIGVNVRQRVFPPEIAARATSLGLLMAQPPGVGEVRDAVLSRLAAVLDAWRPGGLVALLPRIAALDCLKGNVVAVLRTDADVAPVRGVCGGIAADGALLVADERIYAGEAHVVRS